MATIDEVREIALALPGVEERVSGHTGLAGWRLKDGQFAWLRGPSATDLRQLTAVGRDWPEGEVLAVRVGSLEEKDELLAASPEVYFSIPHFEGYPGLLVPLDAVGRDRLDEIITDAWLTRAPSTVARAWLADRGLE